jgi:undecaprenyl-diphosphatase
VREVEDLSWSDALKLGIAHAFALIPGTSRVGATIIGGLLLGL